MTGRYQLLLLLSLPAAQGIQELVLVVRIPYLGCEPESQESSEREESWSLQIPVTGGAGRSPGNFRVPQQWSVGIPPLFG